MKKRKKKIEKPGKNHAEARLINDILLSKKGGRMEDKRRKQREKEYDEFY